MKRIAHIQNGQIGNVSLAPDDWMPPPDGSQMLESDALAQGLRFDKTVQSPDIVTMRSLRLALHEAGLLDTVEAAILTNSVLKIWWQTSIEVPRDSERVSHLAASLGQTEAQVDALFTAALQRDATP